MRIFEKGIEKPWNRTLERFRLQKTYRMSKKRTGNLTLRYEPNLGNHPVDPGLSDGPRESVLAILLGAFSRAGEGIAALEEMEGIFAFS